MKTIIISPFARPLRNGLHNPKTPSIEYWNTVLKGLSEYNIVQVGVKGETKLEGASKYEFNLPLEDLTTLLKDSFTYIAPDNFLPHLANLIPKKGIVIFSQSDPEIFGYSYNINLLKNEKYLRNNQFANWEQAVYIEKAFVKTEVVIQAVKQLENE